jgi:acetyl esterase
MAELPAGLDPQLREALSIAAGIASALGPPEPGIAGVRHHAEQGRLPWNEGGPATLDVLERSLPGPGRQVPVVTYRPRSAGDRRLPVFVYLHGGGFRIGSPSANDRQMREIADAWGGMVISADYLHVPEHVFPAAVEEAAAVLRWLHAQGADWQVDGDRIACGGTSAGAAVAFGAAVALGGVSWLRAAVGIVGAFSSDTATASMRDPGHQGLFPDRDSAAAVFDGYLPDPATRDDPRAHLLKADPALLPITFLAAAQFDVFRDASTAMAERLQAAGRLQALKVYPGMSHLFFGFSRSVDRAAECVQDVARFLRDRLPA